MHNCISCQITLICSLSNINLEKQQDSLDDLLGDLGDLLEPGRYVSIFSFKGISQ